MYRPARAGETFRIYLDAWRAREELGWTPEVGLEEGLRRTVGSLGTNGAQIDADLR